MANGDIEVTSTAKSTTAVTTSPTVTSGAASALSVVGAAGSIASLAGLQLGLSGFKLPMLNPLHKYASYTYNFTLAALDSKALNSPETTYIKGGMLPIVLKTAGGSPTNRIKTKFGAFDFFIDDLTIDSLYGFQQGTGNTNATKISLTISEPYSMGMFPIALTQAALKAKYRDFRTCIFLLKIEFKGADQNGNMVAVPNTTKYIPINFRSLEMSVSEGGAVYKCDAIPAADIPHLQSNSTVTTDMTIVGSTVQEILQTGPRSLQAVLNNRLRETALAAEATIADEIIIMFPPSGTNPISAEQGEDEKASAGKAADAPKTKLADDAAIFSALDVSRSSVNNTLIQGQINEIGAADLGYDKDKQAKTPSIEIYEAIDDAGNVMPAVLNKNPKITEFTAPQATSIASVIQKIVLGSKYAKDALKNPPDTLGFRNWFRIETQIYHVDSEVNYKVTGRKPQIIVYKIVPYKVHSTNMPLSGTKSSKFKQLVKQCAKVYNYIYTGKNTEILRFNLDFDNKFATALIPGAFKTADSTTSKSESSGKGKETQPKLPDGSTGPDGYWNSIVNFFSTSTSSDREGKAGEETLEDRAAKVFHDAVTYGLDLQKLEMDIMGDPYWLTGNGLGNYNSEATTFFNVNKDGTVNFQNGEVDMMVNFRTPIDVNAGTGLYNMAGTRASQFSGLYKVQKVTHRFSGGQFTQSIKAIRRRILPDDNTDYSFDLTKTEPVKPEGSK
jgi:hypothetical protein